MNLKNSQKVIASEFAILLPVFKQSLREKTKWKVITSEYMSFCSIKTFLNQLANFLKEGFILVEIFIYFFINFYSNLT